MINPNNKFAVIIAYYLARFDREGLTRLGFESFNEAFRKTADILGVKKNYVKLRRDEFDLIYSWRRGWQRPMHKQIVQTIEAFQDINETDLYEIVQRILKEPNFEKTEEAEILVKLITERSKSQNKDKSKRKNVFILRGPTGRLAEEYFIQYFNQSNFPISGKLIDMRDYGCGYDFEIKSSNLSAFIEVKGMVDVFGGILFTNKEWLTAMEKRDEYYLIIVKSLKSKPEIKIIKNPASILNPQKSIYTSLQIQWVVPKQQLN